MSSDKNAQQQKIALVTGAAARIGATIAEALHQRGCLVAIHYNSNRDGAESLAERLNAWRGGSAFAVQADLSQSAGVDQLAQRFRSRCERLDVLVNNASRFYPNVVGETRACGTGACAAVVAGRIQDLLDETVTVHLTGGDLEITWAGESHPVIMTGPATRVFEGSIQI